MEFLSCCELFAVCRLKRGWREASRTFLRVRRGFTDETKTASSNQTLSNMPLHVQTSSNEVRICNVDVIAMSANSGKKNITAVATSRTASATELRVARMQAVKFNNRARTGNTS